MKRAYTKPVLQLESFVPQEYVAVCFMMKCDPEKYPDIYYDTKEDYNITNVGFSGDIYGEKTPADNGAGIHDATHGGYCQDAFTIYNDKTNKWAINWSGTEPNGLSGRTGDTSSIFFYYNGQKYSFDQWNKVKNNWEDLTVEWTETSGTDKWRHTGHVELNGQLHS